jgi:hypothetical protein
MLTVQELFAARVLVQVLAVSEKSVALVPLGWLTVMPVSDAFPVLLSVTVLAALVEPTFWLVKVKVFVETPAIGPLPVPLRLTVCGLPASESAILSVAVRVNGALGVKVTEIVQGDPEARVPVQVVVSAKSLALVPVMLKGLKVKLAVPELVTLMVNAGELVVPTF